MVITEGDKGGKGAILAIDSSKEGISVLEMVSGLTESRLKGGVFAFKSEFDKAVRGEVPEEAPPPDLALLSLVVVPMIIFASFWVYWWYRKV